MNLELIANNSVASAVSYSGAILSTPIFSVNTVKTDIKR